MLLPSTKVRTVPRSTLYESTKVPRSTTTLVMLYESTTTVLYSTCTLYTYNVVQNNNLIFSKVLKVVTKVSTTYNYSTVHVRVQ